MQLLSKYLKQYIFGFKGCFKAFSYLDLISIYRPLDSLGNLVGGGSNDGNHGRRKAPKTFAFDHCFWSMDKDNPKFAGRH